MEREDFPVLDSAPILYSDLKWVWDAFQQLSAGRQRGYASLQPLLFSEVAAYATYYYIRDPDEREEFYHFIRFMDQIFMKDVDARASKTPPTK